MSLIKGKKGVIIFMNILIVVGGCLKTNSSANLCHIAYIKGFIESGHKVDVLSVSNKNQFIDESIELPKGANYIYYNDSILMNFVNAEIRENLYTKSKNSKSINTNLYNELKNFILKRYGLFGHTIAWMNKVLKHFHPKIEYDLVISLSTPVLSHFATNKIIENKNVICKKYCQIWEDPWYLDLLKENKNEDILDIEREILSRADKVIYVSPITLKNQSLLIPEEENKYDWLPLPYYYVNNKISSFENGLYFGYFGNYYPESRNLDPFYRTALKMNLRVDICGMPNSLYESKGSIQIYPRLPLSELKKHEDKVNVLILVCNLYGGQIPGKIYQYSATYKKILFILDGTQEEKEVIKSYFSQFNRYYFCENTSESIEQAITKMQNSVACENIVQYFAPRNIAEEIIRKVII